MGLFDTMRGLLDVPSRKERAEAELKNVQFDANLFRNLCLTLHSEAPQNSPILILEAELEMPPMSPIPEGTETTASSCTTECHVKKTSGKNAKFSLSPEGEEKICGWLHELRDSMMRQKQPKWKGIKLTVDVPGDKYNADFRY